MSSRPFCAECGERLTLQKGGIELVDGVTLFYPHDPEKTTWRYVCDDCETFGYRVGFDQMLKSGPWGDRGWIKDLESKRWFDPFSGIDLFEVHHLADEMRDRATKIADTVKRGEKPPMVAPKLAVPTPLNPRSISAGTRARIMERDGFRCRRCGATSADDRLVVDHVIPVAKGGTADEKNLQTLCWKCNAGKSDREPHPHDFGGANS